MVKASLIAVVMVVCLFANRLIAEDAPKPAAELKKLEIWLGEWDDEGTTPDSPLGPASKFKGHTSVRMSLGGFFVEARSSMDQFEEFGLTGWDTAKGRYVVYYFNSAGVSPLGIKEGEGMNLTVEGRKLHWRWVMPVDGRKYQVRQTQTFSEDGKHVTTESQYSEDGSNWKPWLTGASKKTN